MKWINAGDIKYWVTAKRRHCEEMLSELVRRLISVTASSITRIDFPSGDSVTTGGWDGYLDTPSVSPFFPSGISGWEMGIDDSPGRKAENDYATRTANPRGLKKDESTFVFVTPRPWPDRKEWEAAKYAEKNWKGVRTIAASELELWLESAPAVALWLARNLGKSPDAIRDLESVWDEWAAATDPIMIQEVVSAGRTGQTERVHQWLAAAPGVLEVQGDSPDEVLAFLFAAIVQLDDPARTRALSRCLVVDNIGQLRSCIQFPPLIIAAPAQCREAVGLAIQKGHHVFLIADPNTIDFRGRLLQLSRPRRDLLEAALRKNGFSVGDAHRLARDSGASIPVLRRHIFRASIGAPDWAKPESARLLLPILLAGAWNDGQAGDRTILEALAGRPYDEFIKELGPLLSVIDTPIRRIGNVWMLKSPLDAWFLVARHLDAEHLARFRHASMKVLGEIDPKYELDPDQRWAASIYGKQPRYSDWIQQGIVKSLVLLGVHGDKTGDAAVAEAANAVTRDILVSAGTWQAWSSLKAITPLLAEAAPVTFMDALETRLRENPAMFVELLKDDGMTFGECRHAGLLWAIEALAWDPAYFPRAVRILTTLTEIDVGGSWSNRPEYSLRNVFLPRMPQSYAPPEFRLTAFDALAEGLPELAWKIAEGTMTSGMLSAAHQFRWRAYAEQRNPLDHISPENYREYVKGMIPRINRLIYVRPANLIAAVTNFARVEVTRKSILKALDATDPASLSGLDRDRLVTNLREVLHWINTYGDAEIQRYAADLSRAMERFSPVDLLDRYRWLLGNAWPNLPEGEPKDFAEREKLVAKKRAALARLVLDQVELNRILDYSSSVQYVGVFGHAFGTVIRDQDEDEHTLDATIARDPLNEGFVVGYTIGRVEVVGREWVSKQTRRLQERSTSPEAIALLYLGLPENRSTWDEVAGHGAAVESAYWKRARGRSVTNADEAVIAIGKLLDVDRPDAALGIAGDPKISLPSALLQRLLQAVLSFDPKQKPIGGTMYRYYLEGVFKQLYERDELSLEEIAKLEWPFAQILGDDLGRHAGQPLAIHRVLQRDPSFFALLVSFLYKRDDRTTDPTHEKISEIQRQAMVDNARQVLQSWRLLPGLADDGSLVGKALLDWVEAARKQCAETNHVTGGDLQIAEILARSPSDPDGMWPHRAIRDVIERLQNQVIERHVPTAVFNNQGVTCRGIYDGGTQERVLAMRYDEMSMALSAKWPRTAAILNTIAESYHRGAQHEDLSTDLEDLSWE